MKRWVTVGLVCGIMLPGSWLWADPFKILGTRPLGMGGAFVAVAENAITQYWNPAGLATQEGFDLQLSAGASAAFTGNVLKNASQLSDLTSDYKTIQQSQTNGNGLDLTRTRSLLDGLNSIVGLNQPGKGGLLGAQAGMNTRVGGFAFAVTSLTDVGANAAIDTKNIRLDSALTTGLGRADVSPTTGLSGVDLSKLPSGISLNTTDNAGTTSYTTTARDQLSTVISDLVSKLKPNTGGLTPAQIANGLLNYANQQGVSSSQISTTVTQIQTTYQTLKDQGILDNAINGTAYTNNQTKLTLRGASVVDVGVGYAHALILPGLFVGGNLKGIVGEVGFAQKKLLEQNVELGDIFKDFTKNRRSSWSPAVDLGVLYDQRKQWKTKAGIVGRNLNRPKFNQPAAATDAGEPDKFALDPQVRAGVAFYPLHFLVLASDIDLTNNSTTVPGYRSRNVSLGSEINLFNRPRFNLPLRVGLLRNLADNSDLVYTAGFGLQVMHLAIEVGGALSSRQTLVKTGSSSRNLPESVQFAFSLSLLF